MIELFILEQFSAFAKYGTLSEAAESLHLSQPALSRNMKKLEDDLGVSLFDRQKNHMSLNKNGDYFYSISHLLLADAKTLEDRIRDFDRKSKTISVGLCAPAPAWILTPILSAAYPQMTIQTKQEDSNLLISGLDNDNYQLIVSNKELDQKLYYSKVLCSEHLKFSLPKGHRYENRKELSFADMDGESMLMMSDIGFWADIHRTMMPTSKMLVQSDRAIFNDLVSATDLPNFVTDLSEKYMDAGKERVHVPISDPEACVTFYLVCKKDARKNFRSVFDAI